MATTTSTSLALATTTSSGGGGFLLGGSATFVGNTPSTILFFLALAVGVFIAFLFVFFTVRYFVRLKYGVHVYPINQRNRNSPERPPPENPTPPRVPSPSLGPGGAGSRREFFYHLDYIRNHNYVRGELLERRLHNGRRRRRRRRGGRYARMKKLSQTEVDTLFPRKSYADWLDGGKERDHENRDGILQEEADLQRTAGVVGDTVEINAEQEKQLQQLLPRASTEVTRLAALSDLVDLADGLAVKIQISPDLNSSTDMVPSKEVRSSVENTLLSSSASEGHDLADGPAIELENLSPKPLVGPLHDLDLHFTSGTCAICLEGLEQEEVVRGLICGHVFHSDCLDPWLTKRRACCPTCKRDYFYKDPNAATTTSETPEETPEDTPEEDDNDNDSIDYDTLRDNLEFRALIQELIPADERVRMILNDETLAQYNLDERAQVIANSKYGHSFKILWWKVMGIKKSDLFNWGVLSIYFKETRVEPVPVSGDEAAVATPESPADDAEALEGPETQALEATPSNAASETALNANGVPVPETTTAEDAAVSTSPPSDIRRELVENRV